MNDLTIPLRISDPLLTAASQQAQRAGVSIESWLLSLAEERIRDTDVSERFFQQTKQASAGRTLLEILNSAKNSPIMPGDELL